MSCFFLNKITLSILQNLTQQCCCLVHSIVMHKLLLSNTKNICYKSILASCQTMTDSIYELIENYICTLGSTATQYSVLLFGSKIIINVISKGLLSVCQLSHTHSLFVVNLTTGNILFQLPKFLKYSLLRDTTHSLSLYS